MKYVSHIIYGYNEEDVLKVYNLVEKKLLKENPSLSKNYIQEDMATYFEYYGMNYFDYNLDWGEIYIGCIMPGCETKRKFTEFLKEKEKLFKKFDEDHGTNFAWNIIIYSVCRDRY